MEKPKCKDCFWYVAYPLEEAIQHSDGWQTLVGHEERKSGHCHLRPPISGNNPWPQVCEEDFCRCFKPQEEHE